MDPEGGVFTDDDPLTSTEVPDPQVEGGHYGATLKFSLKSTATLTGGVAIWSRGPDPEIGQNRGLGGSGAANQKVGCFAPHLLGWVLAGPSHLDLDFGRISAQAGPPSPNGQTTG